MFYFIHNISISFNKILKKRREKRKKQCKKKDTSTDLHSVVAEDAGVAGIA